MGLFDWLFGPTKNYRELPLRFMLSRQRKLEFLAREASDLLSDSGRLFLVCHFDETLEAARNQLEKEEVPFDEIQFSLDETAFRRLLDAPCLGRVILVQSRYLDLPDLEDAARWNSNEGDAAVLVAEKSPMPVQNRSVVRLAEHLACQCKVRTYVSMDDFLSSVVLGPWVRTLLESMEFGPQDLIENRMIERRIQQAADKIQFSPPEDNEFSEQSWLIANPVKGNR